MSVRLEVSVPDKPRGETEAFLNALVDLAMSWGPRTGWDPQVTTTAVSAAQDVHTSTVAAQDFTACSASFGPAHSISWRCS